MTILAFYEIVIHEKMCQQTDHSSYLTLIDAI